MKANTLAFRSWTEVKLPRLRSFRTKMLNQNFDLVHPGSMFGRVVKDDSMSRVGQKSSSRFHRFQEAAFAFNTQIEGEVRFVSHIAN